MQPASREKTRSLSPSPPPGPFVLALGALLRFVKEKDMTLEGAGALEHSSDAISHCQTFTPSTYARAFILINAHLSIFVFGVIINYYSTVRQLNY